uniref:Uncharacterized protein n=1 Tax=Amphimedon queenslandica TaxID=400682 RepID=A0A1X7TF88_AMPQE
MTDTLFRSVRLIMSILLLHTFLQFNLSILMGAHNIQGSVVPSECMIFQLICLIMLKSCHQSVPHLTMNHQHHFII